MVTVNMQILQVRRAIHSRSDKTGSNADKRIAVVTVRRAHATTVLVQQRRDATRTSTVLLYCIRDDGSNGPPGWQIVLSIRLGCLHCVVAAGGEGKAGAGAETSVEYSC